MSHIVFLCVAIMLLEKIERNKHGGGIMVCVSVSIEFEGMHWS